MNVLVLIPDLKRLGGVANYYRCLELSKEPDIEYMNINSIRTEPSSNSSKSKYVVLLKKVLNLPRIYLKFILTVPKYQAVHINPSLDFKSFFRDMGFILISRLAMKKVIIFFRGWEDEFEDRIKGSKFLSFLFRYTYASADSYIVLGSLFRDKMIDLGVSPDKPFHIETTIADSRFAEHFDIDEKIASYENRINFLFISRILKQKGVYVAIDAFEKCQQQTDHSLHLIIAGDGDELENAKKYVSEKKIENISFPGYVRDDVKKDLLLKSHITIFPTMYGEGLPNCILEGMLYGMPVVTRPIGGIPDVVAHGVNGYLLEHSDSEDFAKYCLKLITNKPLYEKMARSNYDKANEFFTTEAVKARLLSIYKTLV